MRKNLMLAFLMLAALCGERTATAGDKPYFDGKQSLYRQAPANEVAALPKYCWGHYIPKFKGPQYNISRERCGVAHNHFCQGLLQFNRSQHPMASKSEKAGYLKGAIGNFEYTLRGTADCPACPIRRHAKIIYRRAIALQSVPQSVFR
jgi:hypothetical protein